MKSLTDCPYSAILTISKDNTCKCELRTFGINDYNNLALGVLYNNKVYKFPVQSSCTTITIEDLTIDSKLSCAIVSLQNISHPELIMGGATCDTTPIICSFEEESRAKIYEYDDKELEQLIDNELSIPEDNPNPPLTMEEKHDEKTSTIINKTPETFYDKISSQLKNLFDKYPSETILEEILPNSKWIHIDNYEEDGHYCLGIIYQDNSPKYVCYAIPYQTYASPPDDLKEFAQWLPIDVDASEGKGYWITYQDSSSGKSIVVNVI